MSAVKWKLHLKSSPEKAFDFLTTDKGREKFWAESAKETDGFIDFQFINEQTYKSEILQVKYPFLFQIEYFNSIVKFELVLNEKGGTDLTLTNSNIPSEDYLEVYAGWLSVLFALKGAVEFGIDLRNHDPNRTWNDLFIGN